MNPQEAFLEVLIAAMKDAIIENKMTQIGTQLDAYGKGKLERVRIIVVPEKMQWNWPTSSPLGS